MNHLRALAIIALVGACAEPPNQGPGAAPIPSAAASPSPTVSPSAAASAEAKPSALMSAEELAKLVNAVSEPDAEFFSDNYISNETSYLQVADALAAREKGGAYIGVGPEQNFTYIALTEPEVAYVIDIRRDNLILQLLYKALFDAASSRAHFLALLTGRPYAGDDGLAADASIDAVLAHAERDKATETSFKTVHDDVRRRIEKDYHYALDDKDVSSLLRTHRAFYEDGLDIRFKLKEASFRKYPALRELLAFETPGGDKVGFLAKESSFRVVQKMQRENRIVPLVGDFAGDHAMPALAAHMKDKGQKLKTLYVSNVEQYLLVDGKWWKWQRNVAAFPSAPESIFIRCYLDQGDPHPAQMKGHRTATTLQRIADFNEHKKPYGSMLALATDRTL